MGIVFPKDQKIQQLILAVALLELFIGLSHLSYAYYMKFTWEYDEALYDWDDMGGDDGVFWVFWGILTLLYSFVEVNRIDIPILLLLSVPLFMGGIVTWALVDTLFKGLSFNSFTIFALLYSFLFFECLIVIVFLWKSS